MPLALRPRLLALAYRVPVGTRVADIGTDHGRLPLWLLQRGLVAFAYAVDKAEGPLSRARDLAARCGISQGLQLVLGDGLKPLPPEDVDTVVIAGIGGDAIVEILSASPWALQKHLLLQPMTRPERVQAFLHCNGVKYTPHSVVDNRRRYLLMECPYCADLSVV